MAPEFDRIAREGDDLALYRAAAGGGTTPPRVLSFLYLGADRGGWTAPPDHLSLAESWSGRGVYFFSTPYETAHLTALERALVSPGINANRGIGWVSDPGGTAPSAAVVPLTWADHDRASVTARADLALMNVALTMQVSTAVKLEFGDAAAMTFVAGGAGQPQIFLSRGQTVSRQPDAPGVKLSFAPDRAELGQLSFAANWRAQELLALFRDDPFSPDPAWGGEIRYFVHIAGDEKARQLVYPVFPAPRSTVMFELSAGLDPLAPDDARRTVFDLSADAGTLSALSSDFARTTNGEPVRLAAQPGIGLYLGRRLSRDGRAQAYLATRGRYAIDLGGATSARLMCGFTSQEYITVNAGDEIELIPAQPAYADLNDKNKGLRALAQGAKAPGLDSRCTTSWAAIRPALPRVGDRGADYYSQPQNGTNFDRKALAGSNYSAAATALIAPAEAAEPFPLSLYGGVYPPDAAAEGWPNADAPAELFDAAEGGALAPVRFGVLSKAAQGAGPVLCDMAGTPIAGGRSATPNGALLDLGSGVAAAAATAGGVAATPAGGWTRLVLGQSDKGQLIAFNSKEGTGQVDPTIANALLNPQTFMVMNRWDSFREFQGFISVQGVDVNLAPPKGAPNDRQTILVFKYANTETLENLTDRVEAWDHPDIFVGSADEVAAARGVLQQAIQNARDQAEAPGKPFQHFLDILVNPAWTGFLVFNAPLDGRHMPADFQMILGGIDGQLRAHHFGAETNRLKMNGEVPEIQRTSLMGVFFHIETSPAHSGDPPYAFRTTKLIIEIRNSAIQQFSSQVAVTVNQLFERPVLGNGNVPGDSPNTLRLDGNYQVIDGVGRVVFDTALDRAFSFRLSPSEIRVLDQFGLVGAGLSPIAGGTDGPQEATSVTVRSRLALDGELSFVEAPFPAGKGRLPLDIFTYGVMQGGRLRGLPVTGLSLDMKFELGPNGREGGIEITPNLANVVAADNVARRRPAGLVAGLPMRLTGLLSGQAALDAVKLTGKALNIPDLVASGGPSDVPEEGDLNQVVVLNATTPTPSFALSFELPLGSLGDLAETGVGLTCSMILGWGPAASMPEADGVAPYLQLPSLVGGLAGFNLQGFLKTTFGDANLARVEYTPPNGEGDPRGVYVLLFNNVAVSIFGIPLPPKVVTDFILFADPRPNDAAQRGNTDIAWSLAATQVS